MFIVVPRTIILLFTFILLLSVADSQKAKSKLPDQDLKDLLLASIQNTISLTEVVDQQTKEISDVTISLSNAREEIEKLQSSMEELTTKLAEQKEELTAKSAQEKQELTEQITVLKNTTATQLDWIREEAGSAENTTSAKIEDLTSKLNDAKVETEKLQSSMEEEITVLTSKLTNSTNTTTAQLDEIREEAASAENTTTAKIEDLTSKISDVSSVAGTWPSGSYCIMGSGGSCPSGFSRYTGFVYEIYQKSVDTSHISEVYFGDSYVGCYGGCSQRSTGWNVQLTITACCK